MNSIFISAAHKSSGKTIVSIGLTSAIVKNGKKVQNFKKGPDYIDPLWLSHASEKMCRTLDFHLMTNHEILSEYDKFSTSKNLSIIEGNKGLHDGVSLEGADSNGALAKLLGAPVILVIDTRGITRGIAPLIMGQINFDQNINIAGVILNFVNGSRHETKLINAIKHYTDARVIGAIGLHEDLKISERHLGLITATETNNPSQIINKIGKVIKDSLDLDAILQISKTSSWQQCNSSEFYVSTNKKLVRIAVARDKAFGFYYPNDLEALEREGAEIYFFNTFEDTFLPKVDGLFIGGGFPETNANKLSNNSSLRKSIKEALQDGLPAYAECGGLIYLSKSVTWKNNTHEMVGFIPGDTIINNKPIGRGYVSFIETPTSPWPNPLPQNTTIPAHEFHHAHIENLPNNTNFAYSIKRGHGINGKSDGIVLNNVVAGFTHRFSTEQFNWTKRFVQFVKQEKLKSLHHTT